MSVITASDIKELRQKTGAGIMDCKHALEEAEGDTVVAAQLLKAKGLVEVEKRSARATNEGRVFLRSAGSRAALVALACETDFVSRNDAFIAAGSRLATHACERGLTAPDAEFDSAITDLAGLIKENIAIKGMAFLEAGSRELLATYVHGDGRIGVIVKAFAPGADSAIASRKVDDFLHDLCLHVAAFAPLHIDQSRIPTSYRNEKEEAFKKEIDEDERLKNKPAKMLEGILAGKMKKHFASISLVDQGFVRDEAISVAEALRRCVEDCGIELRIEDFASLKIGD